MQFQVDTAEELAMKLRVYITWIVTILLYMAHYWLQLWLEATLLWLG